MFRHKADILEPKHVAVGTKYEASYDLFIVF